MKNIINIFTEQKSKNDMRNLIRSINKMSCDFLGDNGYCSIRKNLYCSFSSVFSCEDGKIKGMNKEEYYKMEHNNR